MPLKSLNISIQLLSFKCCIAQASLIISVYLTYALHSSSSIFYQLETVFDKYGGKPELSKRLDEFIKNQKEVGRPVHVKNLYYEISKAIKKVCGYYKEEFFVMLQRFFGIHSVSLEFLTELRDW